MFRRIREWLSVQTAKNPGRMVIISILSFNVIFFILGAALISALSLQGTEHMGFFEAAYYTVTMVLDAGCIAGVIKDIGTAGVAIVIACLAIIFIGMITFTGAVIGYVTNFISDFIGNANTGARKLKISNHTVILNWNTRASEIINDLLYNEGKEKVVVLVNSRKEEIEKEIHERLSETITRENDELHKEAAKMKLSFFQRRKYIHNNKLRLTVTVIVREGDVFSLKQLSDIQLEQAKAVVILGNEINNSMFNADNTAWEDEFKKGNSQTIKTLMQVADITAALTSADNQKIIVEITDPWTQELVEKIIRSKQVKGKCNIVPLYVNQILGQILSQFSLMPELNSVYSELFSNKGASFYTKKVDVEDDEQYIEEYLKNHRYAIPLASLTEESEGENVQYFYFSTEHEKSINKVSKIEKSDYTVKISPNYWIEKKNVIILGHNSDSKEIMKAFKSFTSEWDYSEDKENKYENLSSMEILRVTVVDDKEHLEEMDYYREFPFVAETVAADIYDKEIIYETINRVITYTDEDTSILILSDDSAYSENIDANALANLVYVQDIVRDKIEENPDFDIGSIDIVVEIIDPKHHDIVNSYNVNNIVISNRYISKMITQISEKEAIYNFYNDILTFDELEEGEESSEEDAFESKEVYVKKVSSFFEELPKPCRADEFVRAVYNESVRVSKISGNIYPTITLGYVKKDGKVIIFSGNQENIEVKLDPSDKIIVYTAH